MFYVAIARARHKVNVVYLAHMRYMSGCIGSGGYHSNFKK